MKREKRWLPWVIDLGIGIVLFFAVAAYRQVFTAAEETVILSGLCDAFFVPGILLVCFGLLAISARGGAFDMLSYGFHSLLVLFTPFRKPENHEKYYEYRLRRAERRKKPKPCTFIVGVLFLALAVMCLLMYEHAGQIA
ncbi:MAG: DUF3899 domain-containing protein [Clostridia bacterium]|nr:DUF3899 domain-containing protein [Clostridia bacterium]